MRITVVGFLTDHKSRVLLRREGATKLAPIHRVLEIGRLPAETLADAFREDTGLIVMPVRLVGVYQSQDAGSALALTYRCTLRGGDLSAATDAPAGYFDSLIALNSLDRRQREQLADALHHAGGPPRLATYTAGLGARLRRLSGRAAVDSGAEWAATAQVVVTGEQGVLWVRTAADEPWRLPAARVPDGQAPWATTGHLVDMGRAAAAPDLRLIRLASDRPALSFAFVAQASPASDLGAGRLVRPVEEAGGDAFSPADVALARAALAESAAVVSLVP